MYLESQYTFLTGMYREDSLERDLTIWAFGCMVYVEANIQCRNI